MLQHINNYLCDFRSRGNKTDFLLKSLQFKNVILIRLHDFSYVTSNLCLINIKLANVRRLFNKLLTC